MKILILGGDGYLGWPTSMFFANKGHHVYSIDNLSKRKNVPHTSESCSQLGYIISG